MLAEGRRLFGTDGVRGKANDELTVDFAMDLARAAADDVTGPVVIGRDTRRSGEMLSLALQAGFHAVGVDTEDVGVLPTAAIAHLTDLAGLHQIGRPQHRHRVGGFEIALANAQTQSISDRNSHQG